MLSRLALGTALIAAAFVPLSSARPALTPMIAEEAKGPSLVVGSDAPAITIEKWLKGNPVKSLEKGKVYVVEFWGPWCGPCVAGMPHLSELQAKYGEMGLTIIGIAWNDWRENTLEKTEKFVAGAKGETMKYTVAWDSEGKTNAAYFGAAGQQGIPSAFVVDRDGKIAYIGLPGRMDKVLDDVINKKHDIKALAEAYRKSNENKIKADGLKKTFNAAAKAEDWAKAVEACDPLIALGDEYAMQFVQYKFNILADKLDDTTKAYAFAKEVQTGIGKDNADMLNALAWLIVDPQGGIEKPDLEVALSLATDADKIAKGEDAGIIDTVARVWFLKGDVKKALELQTKAVEINKEPRMKEQLQKTLDEYKAAAEKKPGG